MRKYFASVVPAAEEITADDEEFKNNVLAEVKAAYEYMDKIEITKAITAVFNIFTHANTYIQKVEPWAVAKAENGQARLKTIMRYLLESIRIGTSLFEPFAPDCTAKVLTALGLETRGVFENMEDFDGLAQGKELGALDILFPRLDVEAETEKLRKIANPEE